MRFLWGARADVLQSVRGSGDLIIAAPIMSWSQKHGAKAAIRKGKKEGRSRSGGRLTGICHLLYV